MTSQTTFAAITDFCCDSITMDGVLRIKREGPLVIIKTQHVIILLQNELFLLPFL